MEGLGDAGLGPIMEQRPAYTPVKGCTVNVKVSLYTSVKRMLLPSLALKLQLYCTLEQFPIVVSGRHQLCSCKRGHQDLLQTAAVCATSAESCQRLRPRVNYNIQYCSLE